MFQRLPCLRIRIPAHQATPVRASKAEDGSGTEEPSSLVRDPTRQIIDTRVVRFPWFRTFWPSAVLVSLLFWRSHPKFVDGLFSQLCTSATICEPLHVTVPVGGLAAV